MDAVEKMKLYNKTYREKNKEKIRKYQAEYFQKNKEKIAKRRKKKRNEDHIRIYGETLEETRIKRHKQAIENRKKRSKEKWQKIKNDEELHKKYRESHSAYKRKKYNTDEEFRQKQLRNAKRWYERKKGENSGGK